MAGRHRGQQHRRPNWRRRLAIGTIGLLVPAVVGIVAGSAQGSTVSSLALAGGTNTVSVGGTLYAKAGGKLTFTVNTSSDTKCVELTGGFTDRQSPGPAASTWTFNETAGSGNGAQTVTATAYSNVNANGCTGQHQNPMSASYVLDNAAPVVTGAVAPTPNAAGWNNGNVGIAWSATDAGSGVASGPTPLSDSVNANTAGVTKTSTATDRLGNSGTGSVTVKLDKSAPGITGTRSPAANVNGWNNTDVTVGFSCSDSPSGVKTCSGPTTLSASAANQSVTGTAADNADNTATATVGGINIDKVAPSLSGSPTTSSNGTGWYNSDVTVHWTAADALSGLDGSAPADSVISGEGSGLTASAAVGDKAGNTTTAKSPPVNIDKTAPTTIADAPDGWNNTDVTVHLGATDALSGVAGTFYVLDGGAQQSGTSVGISAQADHTLEFWSVDKAGNAETHQTVHVKIDKTPPTIDVSQSPLANAHGWNRTDVTVTFTCADAGGSGIASCPAPQTVTTEGSAQPVTGTATDNAGNGTTAQTTVNIDKTPPTIAAATGATPVRNDNGWYNDDVTVSFTCTDDRSGVDSCPAPVTLGEGAHQSASGTATDVAGNTSQPVVLGNVNIDKTPPTLHGTPTTAPGPSGWYTGDVTIVWTCDDNLSGIAASGCPADSVITGEGDNNSVSASVTDLAGNMTTATVSGIRIDRTPPTTLASVPQPLDSGWYASDVTVTLVANDSLSGAKATYYTVDGGATTAYSAPFTIGGGVHTVTYWSEDNAGNVEDATAPGHSLTLMVDKTPPTITGSISPAPNLNGWNNGPVTVTFSCADGESGVQSCPDPVTVSTDGANQTVTGQAVDKAGNKASVTVGPVNIDTVKPTVSVPMSGGRFALGAVAQPTCTATDTLSGVDGACAVTVSGGLPNGVGTFTYTATATDKAGNVSTTTGSYRVVYRFSGFQQPINDPAVDPTLPISIFKGGSTVPAKFRLTDANGTAVQANTVPAWLTPVKGAPTTQAVDESTYTDSGTSGATYRWDPTAQQYIFNWSTKGVTAGFYYRIGVQLDDGETYYVTVGLR